MGWLRTLNCLQRPGTVGHHRVSSTEIADEVSLDVGSMKRAHWDGNSQLDAECLSSISSSMHILPCVNPPSLQRHLHLITGSPQLLPGNIREWVLQWLPLLERNGSAMDSGVIRQDYKGMKITCISCYASIEGPEVGFIYLCPLWAPVMWIMTQIWARYWIMTDIMPHI